MSDTTKAPASKAVDVGELPVQAQPRIFPDAEHEDLHPLVNESNKNDFWLILIVFRCINALCVKTFFQPDEYFQSLEPAWQMAFGVNSGSWITWARVSPESVPNLQI